MPLKAPKPVPDGMHTVTTCLWFSGACLEAIELYKRALLAQPAGPVVTTADGKTVMHAMLRVGDSNIMVADAWPGSWEQGPSAAATAGIWLYVGDSDDVYYRAVKAGFTVLMPIQDASWGDRFGKLKDPYGHTWSIATSRWVYTPEELEAQELRPTG